MKKVIILIKMILCFYGVSDAGWERIYGFPTRLNSEYTIKLYFNDTEHGWVFGGKNDRTGSYLSRSVNGGEIWRSVFVDTLMRIDTLEVDPIDWGVSVYYDTSFSESKLGYIWDICFVDGNVGWLVGESRESVVDSIGLVYKTENGGLNWQLIIESKDVFRPKKIICPTASNCYFFSSGSLWGLDDTAKRGAIGKTKDGGKTWDINNLEGFERRYFMDAHFINTDTGWAVGGRDYGDVERPYNPRGFVTRTTNGGETWIFDTVLTINGVTNVEALRTVSFADGLNGWIGGSYRDMSDGLTRKALLARTEDGGDTWEFVNGPFFQNVQMVYFYDSSSGWVDGARNLHFTYDGGTNWEVAADVSSLLNVGSNAGYIYDIYFLNKNYGWMIMSAPGYAMFLFKFTVNGVSVQSPYCRNTPLYKQLQIRQTMTSKGTAFITYTLNTDAMLSLSMYNLKGKRVAHHPKRFRSAGKYEFTVKIPKGFYVVEAKIHNRTKDVKFTQKIIIR